MNNTIITEGQSLIDVAVQELGNVEALFDLADANNVGITDLLTSGQALEVPITALLNGGIVAYFRKLSKRINTGVRDLPAPTPPAHDFDFLDFDTSDFDA